MRLVNDSSFRNLRWDQKVITLCDVHVTAQTLKISAMCMFSLHSVGFSGQGNINCVYNGNMVYNIVKSA